MDTKKLVSELLGTGLTQTALGEMIGCTQGYLSHIITGRRGKSVSYEIGSKIEILHERLVLKKRKRRSVAKN